MRTAPLDAVEDEPLIDGLPARVPDAYEVATDRVFAAYGNELWTFSCGD